MFLWGVVKHTYSSTGYSETVGSPDIIYLQITSADWAGCTYIFRNIYTHKAIEVMNLRENKGNIWGVKGNEKTM